MKRMKYVRCAQLKVKGTYVKGTNGSLMIPPSRGKPYLPELRRDHKGTIGSLKNKFIIYINKNYKGPMTKESVKSYRKSTSNIRSKSRSIRKPTLSRRSTRKQSTRLSRKRSPIIRMDVVEEGDEAISSSAKMDVVDNDFDPKSPFVPMDIVDDYGVEAPKFDPSFKGLTISFIIMGHGGIKNEVPIETFKIPRNVFHTNIMGMRYAGVNNLVNRQYEENIEKSLAGKNMNIDKLIGFLNKSFGIFLEEHKDIKERVELIRKKHNIGNNFFGIKSNYTKRNAQKFYQGITEKEEQNNYRHSELKRVGPLVKIYSIIVAGQTELLKKGESITLDNLSQNITLTEVINQVTEFVLSNRRFVPSSDKKDFYTSENLEVNLVDLTCNYTKEHPLIGFIEK